MNSNRGPEKVQPSAVNMLTIGLAMLQGARHEHMHALIRAAASMDLDIEIRELRKSSDVKGISGLILPGGESTAMTIASQSEELYSELWKTIVEDDIPVLGTCAGAILLSQQGLVQTAIQRNAFGRQKESFQSQIKIEIGELASFSGVFIRAPRFIGGDEHAIAWLGEEVVGILEGKRMALTFHPELTDGLSFHQWLLSEAILLN